MTTTLITGGNKGLGFEAARRLHEAGQHVVIGSRDPERGAAAAADLGVDWVQIDIASDASVEAAARAVRERFGGLDVLVNNAGVSGPIGDVTAYTATDLLPVLDVNVAGIVRTTGAFLPLLRESNNPVIVNVTSGLGSFAKRFDTSTIESHVPSLGYSASKAALNMLTVIYAQYLPEIRINVVDPGYTATDFNDHQGHQTVTEGTDAIIAMATLGHDGPTSTFTDRFGEVGW